MGSIFGIFAYLIYSVFIVLIIAFGVFLGLVFHDRYKGNKKG